jgi:hypothetical protein
MDSCQLTADLSLFLLSWWDDWDIEKLGNFGKSNSVMKHRATFLNFLYHAFLDVTFKEDSRLDRKSVLIRIWFDHDLLLMNY